PHRFGDFIGRAPRIEDDAAPWLARGDLEEDAPPPLVPLDRLALEAVRRLAAALADARKPLLHRKIEDDGEVRSGGPDGDPLENKEEVRIGAVRALIGAGRVGEAVAQHPFAGGERRPD